MDVRFLQDYTVKDGTGTTYAEGQRVTFDDLRSAYHFINRGVAEEVEAPAEMEFKPKKAAK